MNLHSFCQLLGYGAQEERLLAPVYFELQENCSEAFPAFLDLRILYEYAPLVNADADMKQRLAEVVDAVKQSPVACFLADSLFYGSFLRPGELHPAFYELPPAEILFGQNTGMFYLALALSAFPLIKERNKLLGVPEECLNGVGKWLIGSIGLYQKGHANIPGLAARQLHWLGHSVKGHLFRLGRLEFEMMSYPEWCPIAYQHRRTGKVCLLSKAGISYTPEGYRPSDGADDSNLFHATLEIGDSFIKGYRIHPMGYLEMDKEHTLPFADWEPVVSPWDFTPFVHIPSGGGMTPDAVRDSLNQAIEFFPKYFHKSVKCFISNSWIFHPAWDTELPNSNIVKCGLQGYRFPSFPNHPKSGLFFVFGHSDGDPLLYTQNTSMERAFHRVLSTNRTLGECGWLYLAKDLHNYGSSPYLQP